eukprot:jgi/Orpsp1_1/1188881/evm.model.d7180000067937.1
MSIYDIKVQKREGEEFALSELKEKVLIIGLEILDFPCNQFGHQAPGTDDEIHNFCTLKYDTTFDQFHKIDVNGDNASPLYKLLKEQIKEDEINGTKNKLAMKAVKAISTS